MALSKTVLKNELRSFMDKEYSGFVGFPSTTSSFSSQFAVACATYISTVVPPSNPANILGAQSLMETRLNGISIPLVNGDYQLLLAFNQFLASVLIGMAPAFINPTGSPLSSLSSVYAIGNGGGTNEACINELVDVVDAWIKAIQIQNSSTSAWVFLS